MFSTIREFMRLEASAGVVLFLAAVLALVANNTALAPYYDSLLATPARVSIGAFALDKPLLLWINDSLMAIFFLLVGLEIKREIVDGELSTPSQVILPAAAAVGGIAVPAAIYVFCNWGDAATLKGWAIPTATDIAFSLGVLSLLGSRVPLGLKIFVMAVAIFDDLGAIAIIAIFYTSDLSLVSLALGALALAGLAALNLAGVKKIAPFVLLGVVLWVCVLKSGVHATLAGVALAAAIPLRGIDAVEPSPLRQLEGRLHPWVAYGILPVFAFANAGISFEGLSPAAFAEPVALGIALGLVIGKQLGIFGAAWLTVRLGFARMPQGASWATLYGAGLLCGIGFTMSLFIGTLAFESTASETPVRIGVITGSLISMIAGYVWLQLTLDRGEPAGGQPSDEA